MKQSGGYFTGGAALKSGQGGGWNPVPQPGGGPWAPLPQAEVSNDPVGPQGGGWNPFPQPGGGGNPWNPAGAGGGGGLMQMLGQIFGGGGGQGGGQGGGGNVSLQSLLGLLNGPQGMSNYQQVFTGGGHASPLGGVDIPPANMGDPFGGRRGELSPGDFHTSPFGLSQISGFGNNPSFGNAAFGSTILPTWWSNYPGVGNVPFAVPNTPGGWTPSPGEDLSHHTPPLSTV